MDTIILGIGLGFVFMIAIIIFLASRDKKSNIDYYICQTFTGNQKWYSAVGMVDVQNDGGYTVQHKLTTPNIGDIGPFHQKHMKPGKNNRYFMLLNEWDKGRFRPMEFTGLMEDIEIESPETDKDGQPIIDQDGNVKMKIVKTKAGRMESVPNADFDWVISQRKKNELLTRRREKNKSWWPVIAGGGVFVLCFIIMIYMIFQNAEIAKMNSQTSNSIAAHSDVKSNTEAITKIIIGVVRNETMQQAFKPKPQLPSNPPTG